MQPVSHSRIMHECSRLVQFNMRSMLVFVIFMSVFYPCATGTFLDSTASALGSLYKAAAGDIDSDYAYDKNNVMADRLHRVLNSSDDVISLELPGVSPIGWKDVFRAGSQFAEVIADSFDYIGLPNSLPDLSNYGFDSDYIQSRLKYWNWEKFTNDIMTFADNDVADDGVESDSYSSNIDMMTDLIHSYTSFEASVEAKAELPPECFMTVPQMVRYTGYPCAVYTTVTKDGYKLTMHRIPFGSKEAELTSGRLQSFEDTGRRKSKGKRTRRGRDKRPVVFLQHGILSDSSCWVTNGPNRSLAFVLADAGFDVWMGNIRGNTYSRDHVYLNPDTDEKYWRFSWQQMSEYDLPAMVDAVLRLTDQTSLYYIGHSQGTLIAFARLSEDPVFNKKIKMMFGLAPVATLGHIRSPIKMFSGLTDIAQFGVSLFGGAEIMPSTSLSKWITIKLHKMTQDDSFAYHGHNLLLFLVGFNVKHYHRDRLAVFLAQTPSGTSLHNFIHMSQLVSSGRTQKWDFGSVAENMKAYGQESPPEYDVSKISTPVALFLGSRDDLADPRDARMLAAKLRSMVHFRMIKSWDHLDFMWGKDAPSMLYPDIVEFIENMESKYKKLNKNGAGFRHIRGVDDEL
uniref:gastric triacylglycerol lipase-like n=1 Tax=Styela clava TaxID=7725 RepID=UPI001939EA63|nr:gastric triacylglycerol lipase-like [Styela clava]